MRVLFFFLLFISSLYGNAQGYRRPAVLDEFTPVVDSYTTHETNSSFLFDEKNITHPFLVPFSIMGIIGLVSLAGFFYWRSQKKKTHIAPVESLDKYRALKKRDDSEIKKVA